MSVAGRGQTPRGRRPGVADTRGAILAAARGLFATRGFARASIRSIAAEAGVDPALVLHYFRSKEALFLASLELPFEPETVLPTVLQGDRATIGERFAGFVVSILEDEGPRARMLAIVRAAATEPAAAAILRGLVEQRIRDPLARALGTPDADVRATLVGSQVVGLVMARYVVGVEPLASLPAERVAAAIAPTLQRYLVEPLVPSE